MNADLQELHALLFSVVENFNKTHDAQVLSLDFECDLSFVEDVNEADKFLGSLVFPEETLNLENVYYRAISCQLDVPDDELTEQQRIYEIERIKRANRASLQKAHREGRLHLRRNDYFF